MTRFLSQALQAPEPFFRLGLRRLETAHGNPSADIRFTADINRVAQAKLRELGLDPHDTTPRELYRALHERLQVDDAALQRRLQTLAAIHVSAEADVVAGMVHVLESLPDSRRSFALKTSRLRSLLKQVPPKKAMKQLGYRSVDSFLKHETPVLALTAAWLLEGSAWHRRMLDQYGKLTANDFEDRNIQLIQPTSAKWRRLAQSVVAQRRHNLVCFRELGALVFLPLHATAPAGATTVSLSLALHNLNDIRSSGTFLKLCQVRSDFGEVVKMVVQDEPKLNSQLLDRPVSWHLVQQYYARFAERVQDAIFEPHLQTDDMAWHRVGDTLAQIEPRLSFWQNTEHVGVLDHHHPVSLNIVDAALNFCNQLSFEKRVATHFQRSLWHELMLRYLKPESVERTILAELQPELAQERVLA